MDEIHAYIGREKGGKDQHTLDAFACTDRLVRHDVTVNGHKVHQTIQGFCGSRIMRDKGLTMPTPRSKKFQDRDALTGRMK